MSERLCFTTIGYIEWRKGQDILIDAVEGLDERIISCCEFLLVGQDTSLMAGKIRARISNATCVRMTGTVPREEIHRILERTDLLICPSREDPMPTVCAEAMMHHVPCLISDAVGTVKYIKDGVNGLIFRNEDTDELGKKILWAREHSRELSFMGDRAYEVYTSYFSKEAFEKKLLRYVSEMLNDG